MSSSPTAETAAPAQRPSRARRWARRIRDSEHTLGWLFVASFLETIIVPIPMELVLIPYMVSRRDQLWRTAAVVTAGCLIASLVGYGVGYFLFETAGRWAIDTLGWQDGFQRFQTLFREHGFFAILVIGIVPIPFQTAMLAAGVAAYPVGLFVLAATVARGIRYFGLAGLVRAFGARAEHVWRTRKWLAGLLLVAFIGGFWALFQWIGTLL